MEKVFNGVSFQANNFLLMDTEFLSEDEGKDELLIIRYSQTEPWTVSF